ncbi:hypothetical protein EON63_22615 [archaeon]|nr:MAG: hypothetical protein EON63_22615 [archaeon]
MSYASYNAYTIPISYTYLSKLCFSFSYTSSINVILSKKLVSSSACFARSISSSSLSSVNGTGMCYGYTRV